MRSRAPPGGSNVPYGRTPGPQGPPSTQRNFFGPSGPPRFGPHSPPPNNNGGGMRGSSQSLATPDGGGGMRNRNGCPPRKCHCPEQPCRIHLYGEVWQDLSAQQNFGNGVYPDMNCGSGSVLTWDTPLGAPHYYITRGGAGGGDGGPGGPRGSPDQYRGGFYGEGIHDSYYEDEIRPRGGPGPLYGPNCSPYPPRHQAALNFFIGFGIFVLALLLAYFFAGSKVFQGSAGCTQTDELQYRVCLNSLRPTGESAQVRTLVVLGGLYIVIASLFAIFRFSPPAQLGLGLAGVIVLLFAVYYTMVSPFAIVQSVGGAWLVAVFIILIILAAVGYTFYSRMNNDGEDGVQWCC